jgi:hypothetical protein
LTEHINLETVEAYLASIVLAQGNLLPSPMVILSDDTPLYDEPGVMEEMETAQAEERQAKIDGEIINIENYNTSLITVTFVGAKLEGSYRINIPRQLMQVGYMYNRLLHSPACSIITESEAQMNKDFNSDDLSGEFLPPFDSEDIMVRLTFPKDMSQDTRLTYNYVLNNLRTDYTEGLSKEELSEIAPKIRLVIDTIESMKLRGDVIDTFLGLVEGNEDALVRLYEYAEQVDSAKQALDKNALLSDDEREAVIIFEYMAKVVDFLNPENLVRNINEIEKIVSPDDSKEAVESDEAGLDIQDLFGDDFQSSLDEIITGFRQENPDTVTLTEDSTYEERAEYLQLPSNVIPLMGGLIDLSDRLNVDYYYSIDWNRNEITEEEYGTRGEFLIAIAMLAVQRIHMFGKSIDVTDEVQQMKSLALSLTTEALTQDKDIELWFLKESLYRAAKNDTDALFQFFIMCQVETATEFQIHGPFGQIMHWFSHVMVEEDHTREEMLKAFAKLPIITEFVETLYDDADEMEEEEDDEEEVGEALVSCFATNACQHLPFIDGEPNLDLAKEATQALVIFAELCLRKDDPAIKKGTPEWEEALGIYLNRVLTDN